MEKFKREDIDDDDEEMLENSAEQAKQLERMAEQFDDFGKPVLVIFLIILILRRNFKFLFTVFDCQLLIMSP